LVCSTSAVIDISDCALDQIGVTSAAPFFAENVSKLLLAHLFRPSFKIGLAFNDSIIDFNHQSQLICAQARMYGSLLGREIVFNWSLETREIHLILDAFKGLLSSWKSHLDVIPSRLKSSLCSGSRYQPLGLGANLGAVACLGGLVALCIYPRCKEVSDLTKYNKNISIVYTYLRGLLSESFGGFEASNLADCVVDYHDVLPDIALERAVLNMLRLEGGGRHLEYKAEDVKFLISRRVSVLQST
jgi:hypothetical protein